VSNLFHYDLVSRRYYFNVLIFVKTCFSGLKSDLFWGKSHGLLRLSVATLSSFLFPHAWYTIFRALSFILLCVCASKVYIRLHTTKCQILFFNQINLNVLVGKVKLFTFSVIERYLMITIVLLVLFLSRFSIALICIPAPSPTS
jgi:hypothetical protein